MRNYTDKEIREYYSQKKPLPKNGKPTREDYEAFKKIEMEWYSKLVDTPEEFEKYCMTCWATNLTSQMGD